MEFHDIIVEKGQSLIDIAVQEYGSIYSVNQLLADNQLALNSTLSSGQKLKIRTTTKLKDRSKVREQFKQLNTKINNHYGKFADQSLPVQPTQYNSYRTVLQPSVSDSWVVQSGQSLLDIATQMYGNIAAVTVLLEDNPTYSINDTVRSGTVLKLRKELVRLRVDQNIINNSNNFSAITGELRVLLIELGNETIDHMGWINIDVLGGSQPYTFEWHNSANELVATTQNLAAIPSDTYTVTVFDNDGTMVSLTVTVSATIVYNFLVDQFHELVLDEFGNGIVI